MRKLITSGSTFEAEIGYSRAVVDGDWVFVSGTTGFDYQKMTIADDVVEQARQCLRNIERALAEAGSSLKDIVRVHYILPKVEDFAPCWPVLREYFGEVRPAATMMAAGLSDARMKIEIEVTARRTQSPGNFIQITPFMHVGNIERAIDFFTKTLGFEVLLRVADYAYLHRETVGFRLLEQTGVDEAPPGNRRFAYYIDVRDVDRLHAELRPKLDGLPKGDVHGPVDQGYGQRELMVLAPDGNLIVFGQAIKKKDGG
jgi:enamine deaminase RidA (YjgF/YER057c/UK114 family)/catechol 2,3-dioxygenase-like lactoylglutathione lyase family enzyme